MLTNEQISANFAEGLRLMDEFPMGAAPAQKAARRIVKVLNALGVPYVVFGGLAVHAHGLARATDDVDLIIGTEGLRRLKAQCLGKGWKEKSAGSRRMLDTELGVFVDAFTTAEKPGDGKSAPFTFPDPTSVEVDVGGVWAGIKLVNLRTLIELKLANAKTTPHRFLDRDDVIRLIKINRLPRAYGDSLHEFARDMYDEHWQLAQVKDPHDED